MKRIVNNKNMKTIFKNKYIIYALILIIGIIAGRFFFGSSSGEHHDHDHVHASEDQVWTCSMHPQIRSEKPGKCPLCAMDLIPVRSSGGDHESVHPDAIQLSEEAIALANVQTTVVSKSNPVKEIQLYGSIQADETKLQSQTSHVSGRIESMKVSFTGESIQKGQTIALVYSPELMNAQQELLEALKISPQQDALIQAAKEKLKFWKLTDEQIEAIISTKQANPVVAIQSNTSGVVMQKNVNSGDYVEKGNVLLDIADLSTVWAMFEAYEEDLAFLKKGNKVDFTIASVPGKKFSGQITFIDEVLNPESRTAKLRVSVANGQRLLKPGMYASASIQAALPVAKQAIVIPGSAVLWTGKRSIVYVQEEDTETPAFMLREVVLGPSLGSSYVVMSGLLEGERIVTNGTFTIDASAQLEGKRSMMNEDETVHKVHKVGKVGKVDKVLKVDGHADHGVGADEKGDSHQMQVESSKVEHAMLKVGGACGMCTTRIENTAKEIQGVSLVKYNLDKQELHIEFDSKATDLNTISKALAAVGHDTDRHKADDAVYEALPGCCHYR
jgi:Cu(I)/Ag(I) efflux system membrane fusion protein